MSPTTEPSTDLLLALCCECGSTRTVSRRASGSGGNRPLRCDACRKTTPHAAIGADRIGDWRESLDHKKKPNLSVDDKLDVLEAMGARVRYVDVLTSASEETLIAAVWWYMQTNTLAVDINQRSSDADIERTVSKILDVVADPRKYQWRVLHTLADGDGEVVLSMGYR